MDIVTIDDALRAVITVIFAYIAIVGGAGALKYAVLDQEARALAKVQRQLIERIGAIFEAKAEERIRIREKRMEERVAMLEE